MNLNSPSVQLSDADDEETTTRTTPSATSTTTGTAGFINKNTWSLDDFAYEKDESDDDAMNDILLVGPLGSFLEKRQYTCTRVSIMLIININQI